MKALETEQKQQILGREPKLKMIPHRVLFLISVVFHPSVVYSPGVIWVHGLTFQQKLAIFLIWREQSLGQLLLLAIESVSFKGENWSRRNPDSVYKTCRSPWLNPGPCMYKVDCRQPRKGKNFKGPQFELLATPGKTKLEDRGSGLQLFPSHLSAGRDGGCSLSKRGDAFQEIQSQGLWGSRPS